MNAAVKNLNVANVLTVVRVVLVPVFVYLFIASQPDNLWLRLAAWLVFVIAAITDAVDGNVARKYGLITNFGKIADPIADKLLVGAALICLSAFAELPWTITVIILVREIGITVLRLVVVQRRVLAADRAGKLKTIVQTTGLIWLLLPLWLVPGFVHTVGVAIMWVAAALTLYSGARYLHTMFGK